MKHLIAVCALFLCAVNLHAAGFQTLDIPGSDSKSMSLAIWYPSQETAQEVNLGTFKQLVARNGAVDGNKLPLVLISHGNGGYLYSHHDTALALANAGFIVLALTHPGDNFADQSAATDILRRPGHIRAALDYMLKDWPHRDRIAAASIGVFGFSSGGFTALVSIGGQPDMNKVHSHCAAHPAEYACKLLIGDSEGAKRAIKRATAQMHERRIRAAVIAAPALGFTFDAAALNKVDIPIQLWRAEDDEILPHPYYTEHVRLALPRQPEYHLVQQAGHFDFLAPCTGKLAAVAPQICLSQAGFDRAAFHERFNAAIIGFFRKALQS